MSKEVKEADQKGKGEDNQKPLQFTFSSKLNLTLYAKEEEDKDTDNTLQYSLICQGLLRQEGKGKPKED